MLLAEDNPINAMLARTLLVREGCTVEHVTGGEAALEALIAQPFDLVLMDVRMPGMSGLDATRALRARGVTTPVVASISMIWSVGNTLAQIRLPMQSRLLSPDTGTPS